MKVRARAHPNIALVKYWGKRDPTLNLPTHGSLSVTVGGLYTEVEVEAISGTTDRVEIEGEPARAREATRIGEFLTLVRKHAGSETALSVSTRSNFPMSAGLASSSSSFAALALASCRVLGLPPDREQASLLARFGSGSATRSIHGGFVEWRRGTAEDGSDSFGVPIHQDWDLRVLIAVISSAPKAVSSREGMARTTATSPLFPAWVDTVEGDLAVAREALGRRDLPRLGKVMEASCLKMVATMLTSSPPLHYWAPETLGVVQAVERLRAEGLPGWFTTDAGPNVKVLCSPEVAARAEVRLAALPGVQRVLVCPVGGAADVEELR